MPASSSQVFTQAPRGSPATRNASAPQQRFPSAAHTTDAFYRCYSRPFSPSPACPPLFLLWEKKAGFPEFVLYLRLDAKGMNFWYSGMNLFHPSFLCRHYRGVHCHCIWELQNCDSIQKFAEQKLHYATDTHGAVLTSIVWGPCPGRAQLNTYRFT